MRHVRWGLKMSVIVGAITLSFVALPRLRAGEYHTGTNLKCADCHTMHYSQRHTYQGNPFPGDGEFLAPGGPFEKLLRAPENQLCQQCHDGQTFAPDVIGANTLPYTRQAGALTTGSSPYEDWKGHTLGSTDTAPGGTWSSTEGLKCTDCHAPHGNQYYRNLRHGNVTYAKGTNDTTKDVFLRAWTFGDIATNYSVDNVDLNEPNTTDSAIGRFCKACHADFHGSSSDPNMKSGDWLRHPTADADITGGMLDQFASHPYRVKVMSPTGNWGTQGQTWTTPPTDLTPTCISCHKAHGNKNPFGLIFLEGTGPVTEEGDQEGQQQGVRALCKQCHVQGD